MGLIPNTFLVHQIIHKFTVVHVHFHALHASITLSHAKVVHKAIFIFPTSTNAQQTVPPLITKYQALLVCFVTQAVINAV